MRLISTFVACVLICGCGSRTAPVKRAGPAPNGSDPIVIRGAMIIDVADGSRLPGRTVVVEGGKIVAVQADSLPVAISGGTVVDAGGMFLIPGLWDMHTHSLNQWEWALPLHVANGVTGIRDMATSMPMHEVHRLRERIRAGEVAGPRIITGGPLVDGPTSYRDYLKVATPGQARAVVDSLHREGVDFIKVYEDLPREAFLATVDAARLRGLSVVGHVPIAFENPSEAVDAGMSSVEHIDYLMFVCTTNGPLVLSSIREAQALNAAGDSVAASALLERAEQLWETRLPTYSARACTVEGRKLRARSTWLTPTLSLALRSSNTQISMDVDAMFAEPSFRYVPPATLEQWRRRYEAAMGDTLGTGNASQRRLERAALLAIVRDVHRAGAPLLAGTDGSAPFQVYGFNLHQELGWLVEAGLTPLEALQTATRNPVRYLGGEGDSEKIAPGAVADLVLLDADPLVDIANSRSIVAVIADGRLFRRAELDELLESVAEAHATATR